MTTQSKQLIRRGDIYLVNFEKNKGAEQNGLRPALILQNDIGNVYAPTTMVCPMTSSSKKYDRTHVVLLPEESGVLKKSVVLCEQLRVVDKSRLSRKVGEISSIEKMMEVENKTCFLLGFCKKY